MAQLLPVTGSPSHSFSVPLSGKVYNIRVRWVTRTGGWYISIADSDQNEVIGFERLTPQQPVLIDNFHLFPDGNLMVIQTIDEKLEPLGRNNFGSGNNYELVFLTNAELEG